MKNRGDFKGHGYANSGYLCSLCSLSTTDACYNCGPEMYWRSFEPRKDALENPPEFPSLKKWYGMGFGEKLNVLGL